MRSQIVRNDTTHTSILGVDKEFIQFICHALRQAFAVNFDFGCVADLGFADVNLERRVWNMLTMAIDINQIVTDFTWSK